MEKTPNPILWIRSKYLQDNGTQRCCMRLSQLETIGFDLSRGSFVVPGASMKESILPSCATQVPLRWILPLLRTLTPPTFANSTFTLSLPLVHLEGRIWVVLTSRLAFSTSLTLSAPSTC